MIRRAAVLVMTIAICCLTACRPPEETPFVVGAKNFTEQVVLGELLAQEIEATTGRRVERRFYLAGTYICHQALIAGRIDAYVEYSGTALSAVLKQPIVRDASAVRETVRSMYASRFNVVMAQPLGFEDTFALVVRAADADRLRLRTVSDLLIAGREWRLGVGYEFEERPDGLRGLKSAYGLHFADAPRVMDLGLLYRALQAGQVDVVAGNSTDGPIQSLHLKVLEDDRHYFPPYEAVPLVRREALQRPGVRDALARIAGKVTAEEIQALNHAVDGQKKDVGEEIRKFRLKKGL